MGRGDDILAALKNGEYQGRATDVSEYITSLPTNISPSAWKQYCIHAQGFLYVYTVDFEKLPPSEITPAIQASQDCATVIKTHSTNPKDVQTAEKLLYHLLNKGLKKGRLLECVGLSKTLREFLLLANQSDEASVQMIAQSSYTVLWNAAVKEERDPNADVFLCLQLRFLALLFLLQTNKAMEKGPEVIPWTIDHYGHVLKKRKMDNKNLMKVCDLMNESVTDLSMVIEMRLGEIKGKNEPELVIFQILQFEMYVHLSSFSLMHDLRRITKWDEEVAVFINQFQGLINRMGLEANVSKLVMELLNVGISMSFFMTTVELEKKLPFALSELMMSMEKANDLLSSPAIHKSLSIAAIQILHCVIHFCFKLPEDGTATSGKVPKITVQNMSEEALSCLVELHKSAGKFYVTASKLAAKHKESKLVVGIEFAKSKILQYQLTHQLNLLEGLKGISLEEGWSEKKEEIVTSAKIGLCELDTLISRDLNGKNRTTLDELYYLASLSQKFGRFCVNRGLYKEAEWFLKSSLAQFKRWIKDTPADKRSSVHIWKKYELLADSQRKAGMLESALSTIAEGVCEDPENLSYACELWVRVRMEIMKSEHIQSNTRSLWSFIKGKASTLRAENVLMKELTLYKRSQDRTRCHELTYSVIEELLGMNKLDPVSHAVTLLDKTQVLWLSRKEDEMSPADCCERAIDLLEGARPDAQISESFLYDLTARAYLWNHLVSSIDPIELREFLTKKNIVSAKTESNVEPNVEVQEDNEIYHDCCTIDMELLSASSADKALELWAKATSKPDAKSSIQCLNTTTACLESLTDYYRLTRRMTEEYRSLSIRLQLLSPADHPVQYLQAQTSLIELFSRLNQPSLALPVIATLEKWLEEEKESPKSCQKSASFVMYLLAKAEVMLLTGKVNESCEAVHQAKGILVEHFKVRSTEALMMSSRIYRMASRIVKLPISYHDYVHEDCCLAWSELGSSLELVNCAAKLISGVVCFLMADWLVSPKAVSRNVPLNTVRKWFLLDELLISMLYTGATYVEFGEVLDANCYLQQGLRLAQAFHIPRRFADFHLEICKLNNMRAKYSESQSHINISSYVLNTLESSHASSKDAKTPARCKSKQYSEVEDEDSDSEEMIIKTRPIEMPDVLESEVKPNAIGSPASKKWRPSVPKSWLHSQTCHCNYCSDVTVQGLLMKQTLQQALCFYQQGLNYQAEASWEMLLDNFDAITSRVQQAFHALLCSTASTKDGKTKTDRAHCKSNGKGSRWKRKEPFGVYEDVPRGGLQLLPVMYQSTLVEVGLYLTELSICQQKWEFYEQWLVKLQDLMNTETYPWMLEHHSFLAKIYYLKMVPGIPWPEVVEKTELEELCERIGGVKMPRQKSASKALFSKSNGRADDRIVPSPKEESLKISPIVDDPPKLTKSKSQSDVSVKKPLRSKLTAKATNSRNKRPSPATDVYSSPPVQKSEVAPLQRKKTGRKSSEDSTDKLKPTYKTPARPNRLQHSSKFNGASIDLCTPSVENGVPEYMAMFKTPRSVSGRRAQLDMLINSDEEDDLLLPVKSALKKKPTGTKITALSARRTSRKKPEKLMNIPPTPPKKLDILSPSGANKMALVKSLTVNKETKVSEDRYMTPKSKSPMSRLFKSSLNRDVIMEIGNDENVYDFIPSSPEETPVGARGKKKPGRPGRKPAALKPKRTAKKAVMEEIEVVREKDNITGLDTLSDAILDPDSSTGTLYSVKEESPVVCEPVHVKASSLEGETFVKRNNANFRTLTRSKTAKLETNRAEDSSSEESLSLSFDIAQFLPEDEDNGAEDGESSPERGNLDPHNDSGCDLLSQFTATATVGNLETLLPNVPSTDSILHSKHLEFMAEPIEVPRGDDKILNKKRTSKRVPADSSTAVAVEGTTEKPRLSRSVDHDRSTQSKFRASNSSSLVKMTRSLDLSADLEGHLDRAFNLLKHQPTPVPYRQVCHAKILLELNKPAADPWTLAYFLTESHSVSFRHNALANIDRKLETLRDVLKQDKKTDCKVQHPYLDKMKVILSFGGSKESLKENVSHLEDDWTVIQVSVLTAVGEPRGRLVVTRFTSQNDPIVLHLPGFSMVQGQKLLNDFSSILKTNNSSMSLTNKVEWWSQRISLDEKLKETLESIESRWFGCWLGALQGRLDNDDDEEKLRRASLNLSEYIQKKLKRTIDSQLVKLMLQCHHHLDEHHVRQMLTHICACKLEEDILVEFLAKINGVSKSINLAVSTKSRPVILILDRAVQHIPWESMPSLRGQPVSRIPSLHFLCAHLQAQRDNPESVYNTGVDTRKTFYVLNPDDNLESTQSTFETRFQSEKGWDGIVGKPPTNADFTKAITEHDQFIYCGHGSGSKFLSRTTLASLKCRAVVFLMGCSSGKLSVDGQFEASGLMLNYFLSGCPSIVACLWDITDRDIDRYLEELLRRWLQSDNQSSLLESVHQSMDVCKLPYLTGSAPAVYGLPVYTKSQ